MLCRCARVATASWRGAAVGSTSRPSLALLVAGAPSNGAEAQRTTGGADFGVDAPALQRQPRAGLSTAAAAPKLVYAAPREEGRDVVRTPPMEEEDTGPAVREMRAQLRPSNEHGSRGARKLRKEGKIPGVVYSNNDSSAKGSRGETFLVKVDKIVLDREIRRLKASFDNTVYDLVIEGARPSELDDEEVGFNLLGEGGAEGGGGGGEGGGASPSTGEDATATAAAAAAGGDQPERRELVLANETRLHPVFRTVLSVNWMRYKAGRKYPIPVKFINDDLNDNFKKGAYIRRMKSHQHIILPEDPEKVPKWLYLDLETVRSGSKLRVSDILLPEGILLFRGYDPAIWNEVVCTIKGRKLFGGDSADREDEDE